MFGAIHEECIPLLPVDCATVRFEQLCGALEDRSRYELSTGIALGVLYTFLSSIAAFLYGGISCESLGGPPTSNAIVTDLNTRRISSFPNKHKEGYLRQRQQGFSIARSSEYLE